MSARAHHATRSVTTPRHRSGPLRPRARRSTGASQPLKDQEHGSRQYTARDPKGDLWTFGTCRPKAGG